jgi:hypothetical protein
MNQVNQIHQKQIFPIEILGAIICANSIFTLLTFVISVLSLSNISKVLSGNKLTDSELWFNSLSTGMSQVSVWTALLGGILWLVWLFLCFGKYNFSELKKVNQIGTILHYILGSFLFGIPFFYLPFHHYFLLFGKVHKNSKLPLVWQILNILTCLTLIPLMFLIWVIIFLPFLMAFFGPILTPMLGSIGIYAIFILLLYTAQTLLGCFFVWQISEKL